MSPTGRGFLDAAYQVLEEAGHPMHGREIVQACLERGLWVTDALDPNLSGSTTLYSEARRHPGKRGFTMLGKGRFGLKEWDDRGAMSASVVDSPPADPAHEQPVTFSSTGRSFTLTGQQVLDAARRALADGLPPESQEYLTWVVEIDGQLVGLKWMFSLVTGVPRSNFSTFEAASIFRRMGLSVRRLGEEAEPESHGSGEEADLTPQRFLEHTRGIIASLLSSHEYAPQARVPNRRLVQVAFEQFSRSHFEICIHPDNHEVGLHFESSHKMRVLRNAVGVVGAALGERLIMRR